MIYCRRQFGYNNSFINFISNPEVLFHYKFLSRIIILVRGKIEADVIEAIFSTTGLRKGTFVVVWSCSMCTLLIIAFPLIIDFRQDHQTPRIAHV